MNEPKVSDSFFILIYSLTFTGFFVLLTVIDIIPPKVLNIFYVILLYICSMVIANQYVKLKNLTSYKK